MRNLQELVKKAFYYQKIFWPFNVWINCSSDLKFFANSRSSALNFKSFSQTLEQIVHNLPLLRHCGKICLFITKLAEAIYFFDLNSRNFNAVHKNLTGKGGKQWLSGVCQLFLSEFCRSDIKTLQEFCWKDCLKKFQWRSIFQIRWLQLLKFLGELSLHQ